MVLRLGDPVNCMRLEKNEMVMLTDQSRCPPLTGGGDRVVFISSAYTITPIPTDRNRFVKLNEKHISTNK